MKLLFGFVSLFIYCSAFTQSNVVPPKLKAAFESSYLQQVQLDNPILLKRWIYYLDNSYYIADNIPNKMVAGLEAIKTNLTDVNIFLLEKQYPFLLRDWDKPMAYKIKNTDKLLVYYSGKQFNEAFQNWLTSDSN